MATTQTSKAGLLKQAKGDRNWDVPVNANADMLDGTAAVGGICCIAAEYPSASLNVNISAGSYVAADGAIGSYAGSAATLSASATTSVYLDAAGTLQLSTSGFPASPAVPIAVVATGPSAVTSIADARVVLSVCGPGIGYLTASGGTLAEGGNLALGTATGTKLGTAAAQKLGFYGATPVAQPAGAGQAALAAMTSVGATNSADVSAAINSNFTALATLLAALRSALVAEGLIKGSA